MATLNTLRTKGGLIVSIVIGVSLVAFLLGDFASNGSVFSQKITVGEINGEKISYQEYLNEVDYLTNINKIISGSEANTPEQQDAIKNVAWEKMINTYSVFPGYEELGIGVSEAEMFDLIYGNNISPVLQNSGFFNNQQTGAYDKALVKNFVTNLANDQTGNIRAIWTYLQDQVRNHALMSKYMGLVSKMVYVTDVEVAQGVANTNNFYNARYAVQTYESISDSTITVSNAEIKKYYDSHKNYFKQVASRDVEYVVFDVVPSEQDYADAAKEIEALASEFAAAENVQQFVTLNSQEGLDSRYYSQSQMPEALAAFAFSAGKDAMYGPVLDGDTYSIVRISDIRSIPDSISVRQIMLAPGNPALADSVITVLKGGANFADVANQFSVNPMNGGDMGKISTDMLPSQILNQILGAAKGEIIKIENPNGTTLVDVYYRGTESRKAQLAAVKYKIEPSSATQQAAYAKASKFVADAAGSYDNFNKSVTDNAYSKRVARVRSTDNTITGIENGKELIRWAFNAEQGDISAIMEIDNNYLVSAMITEREDGFAPVDLVSAEIALAVRKEKKGAMLAEKMTGTSVTEIAQKLGAKEGEITDLNFNAYYIPEVGMDPMLIGAICGGVKEGAVSKPVKAATGVYVVEVTAKDTRTDATPESEKVRIEAVNENYIDQRAAQALQEMSNVHDMRVRYF